MTGTIGNRRMTDILGLLAFLAACFVVSALGGLITASSVGGWYQTLAKPPFNPPDWLFAPVWAALYLMMAIAGWRIWRRLGLRDGGRALFVYAAQLALNLGWSAVFFGLRMPGAALAVIGLLLAAIVVTTRLFWTADRLAGIIVSALSSRGRFRHRAERLDLAAEPRRTEST